MDIIIRHKFWAIIVLKCFMSLNSSFNAIIPKSFKMSEGRGEAYDRSNEIKYVRCIYEYHVVSSLNATIWKTQPFPNVVRCSLFMSTLRKIENNLSNKGLLYNRLISIFLKTTHDPVDLEGVVGVLSSEQERFYDFLLGKRLFSLGICGISASSGEKLVGYGMETRITCPAYVTVISQLLKLCA